MSTKWPPPAPRNPLAVTLAPLCPPGARSRAALGLAVAAARGKFCLQVCAACAAAQYPPRDVCGACLSAGLAWREVPTGGIVLAQTTVRVSADPYFRSRTPWRIGTVALDCGPRALAHLHGDVAVGGRVRMALKLDKSGQGVMFALPAEDTPHQEDDRQLREMTCNPEGRRVLVTDGRGALGQAIVSTLIAAGARTVFVGIAEAWRPFAGADALAGAEIVPLDLSDADSVQRMAASLGGRVEIVVNTAADLRPTAVLGTSLVRAREAMEANYFSALRLAQALGPALRGRAADGTHPACAWVTLVSADALAGAPQAAAALALVHSLRLALRPLKLVTMLLGPIDDEWHQHMPPPKLAPAAVAAAVVQALREGLEEVAVGDIAQDRLARWCDNPSMLAHEIPG